MGERSLWKGKEGARVGQEDGVWMAGRTEEAIRGCVFGGEELGVVGVARMRSGKISELGVGGGGLVRAWL